jgi:4-diphosphocytidyl-2-C-methyl-D-erythritol kinase
VRVPAKVNLHLSVDPPRPDGFHELLTVFHAVDLVDEVLARPADRLSLTISGEGAADLPTDEGNLAWRAAALLARTAGLAPRVHLEVRKAIPVAGGMAGGSADAAATLVACARLWDLDVGPAELTALAAQLGSDVAFPLLGGTALGTGRGEILTPVPCATRLHWVFALADLRIGAGEAYRELDRLRGSGRAPGPSGPADRLLAALADGDVVRIAALVGNDLQAAALSIAPRLADTLAAGTERGALAALVSGSGPTCAFLCADAAAATVLAAELEAARVCRTARVATGPSPGAI